MLFQCQAHYTESVIRREFEKIHQFLWDEEAARVSALREEEKQRVHAVVMKMPQINRDISVLSDKITATEEEIETNNVSFLQVKSYILRQQIFLLKYWYKHKVDHLLFWILEPWRHCEKVHISLFVCVFVSLCDFETKPKAKLTPECSSRTECEQKDPEINYVSLIDMAKHLGNLKFRVWKKMLSIIKYSEFNCTYFISVH